MDNATASDRRHKNPILIIFFILCVLIILLTTAILITKITTPQASDPQSSNDNDYVSQTIIDSAAYFNNNDPETGTRIYLSAIDSASDPEIKSALYLYLAEKLIDFNHLNVANDKIMSYLYAAEELFPSISSAGMICQYAPAEDIKEQYCDLEQKRYMESADTKQEDVG